jgi:hypothetical protein
LPGDRCDAIAQEHWTSKRLTGLEESSRQQLALGLAAIAERMEPAAAARLLTQVLEKETNAHAR